MDFETFKREVGVDPYTHMILRMRTYAWLEGYAEARRRVERGATADDLRRDETLQTAHEALTHEEAKREREHIVALAALGPLLGTQT